MLPYSFTTQALSASTANTIQGTSPYLEYNGTRVSDLSHLVEIQVNGITYVSDAAGNMKKRAADGTYSSVSDITLPNVGDTFGSVITAVSPDGDLKSLNSLSSTSIYATRKDDDNDINLTLTGDIKGEWKDKNGNSVGTGLTGIPSSCFAPYTLTLTTSGSPSISSQYGDPKTTSYTYGNSSAKFKIYPSASQSAICFATPDMNFNTSPFAGPADKWDPIKGFITQSSSPSSYKTNFPTTSADGLHFDLIITNATTALTWPSVTVSGITATMTNPTPTSVTVTLTGPTANATQIASSSPTAVTKPLLPARFELKGMSGGIPVVTYGFEIKQWYINRDNVFSDATSADAWCASAGYSMPKVKDLTNSSGTAWGNGGTIPGSLPPSGGNNLARNIGGGFFSEWAELINYDSSSTWQPGGSGYVTSDTYGTTNRFGVDFHYGFVYTQLSSGNYWHTACVAE